MIWQNGDYHLSDEHYDIRAVCSLLADTYWGKERACAIVERSLRNSLAFSLYHGSEQVGIARVITDRATVGYLCDVVISQHHRGQGIGKWMMRCILEHPHLKGCRIDLFTADAQEFYRAFGFGPHKYTSMVRYAPKPSQE